MQQTADLVPGPDVASVSRALSAVFDGNVVAVAEPHPSGATVFSLDVDGEPSGVEVIVGDMGSWTRVDGEDGTARDPDDTDGLVADAVDAVARRTAGPAFR